MLFEGVQPTRAVRRLLCLRSCHVCIRIPFSSIYSPGLWRSRENSMEGGFALRRALSVRHRRGHGPNLRSRFRPRGLTRPLCPRVLQAIGAQTPPPARGGCKTSLSK